MRWRHGTAHLPQAATLRHFHARPLRALGTSGVPVDELEELGGSTSRGLFEAGLGLREGASSLRHTGNGGHGKAKALTWDLWRREDVGRVGRGEH